MFNHTKKRGKFGKERKRERHGSWDVKKKGKKGSFYVYKEKMGEKNQ